MHYYAVVLAVVWGLGAHPIVGGSDRSLVGHVMALLAVFEEADVLPPEKSPEANAIIHALIQTQAALTKSTNPATRQWFTEALRQDRAPDPPLNAHDGLTSRSLEAILNYAAAHPPVERPAVLEGLREFNVGQSDFDLMARIYREARERYRSMGHDIHRTYDARRRAVPFQ